MKRKHRHEIRPGRAARRKIRRRATRNKNAVNFHFPARTSHCVIVLCRRVSVTSRIRAMYLEKSDGEINFDERADDTRARE